MRLWNTCAWSQDWPKCDSGSCKDGWTELFSSHSGSGGSDCSGKQKRKYCCDNQRDFQWGNCEWYEHAGEFPGSLPDGQCLGGCPNNKYAVSLETKGGGCSSGARAMCCENGYQTREKRMNSNDQEFDYMLSQFLPDAKCSSDADSKLGRAQTIIIKSLQRIMYSSTTAATRKVWDSRVTLQFKHLTAANLAVFAQKDGSAISVGLDVFPGRLLCAMTFYNSRLGGEVDETCECGRKPCCSNNICPRDDDEGLAGRGVYSLLVGRNASEVDDEYAFLMGLYDDDDDDHYSDISSRDVISYDWKVFSPWVGDYVSGAYKNIDFPSSGEGKSGDSVFSRAIDFISQACKDFGTITVNIITNTGFDSEHIVERQSVRSLIESTLTGELASGADSDFAPLDPVFWTTIMQEQVTDRPTVFKMKTKVSTRMDHLMNGLGSYTNTDVFALAASGLNNMKSKLWKEDVKNLVAPGTMKKLRQDTRDRASASRYIKNIRKVTASLQYLNNPTVVKLLLIIIQDIKKELSLAEAVYYAANNIHLNMEGRFDEWFIDFLGVLADKVVKFVATEAVEGTKVWAPLTGPDSAWVLELLNLAEKSAKDFQLDKALKAALRKS
ncbi:hypothetical protein LMH87_010651 [Akanthomyces muscarius]|uniref:Uncharacterized protein n=1 Tax=Akanthomyces muscarius TaxID=2231603 RepID=A0A9W8QA81_AKAMU|nr:hypothetical protein LMH87_010651 [Akanthomyces muscarius]KAJ4149873.1 hypothetical protein LMH87_010651 [Akanthomyces muscarius]